MEVVHLLISDRISTVEFNRSDNKLLRVGHFIVTVPSQEIELATAGLQVDDVPTETIPPFAGR